MTTNDGPGVPPERSPETTSVFRADFLTEHEPPQAEQPVSGVDALPAGEGCFLPCSFWLADCYLLTGRREEGEAMLQRLLGLCNDVGLLAEEYDPRAKRMLGNFPQALTHMAILNTVRLASIPAHAAKSASERGMRPAAAPEPSPTAGA